MEQQQEDHHDSGCLGCTKCRDDVERALSSCHGAMEGIAAKLKLIHPFAYSIMFAIFLTFCVSVVALSIAVQNRRIDDCCRAPSSMVFGDVKSDIDEYLALNATHAVIALSDDTRERNIQLWNLHNINKVLEVPDYESYRAVNQSLPDPFQ